MRNTKMKIEVMLDIFSGRPNPRWQLSEEQSKVLKLKLSVLPAGEWRKPTALGYRGIRVSNVGGVEGLPERIRAYDGVLAIVDREETNYYADINGVENWLINQAREEGFGEAINRFWEHGRNTEE